MELIYTIFGIFLWILHFLKYIFRFELILVQFFAS